jgi:hypothetical protein
MNEPTAAEHGSETLEQFKSSFAYGTRTDLLFKFLKDLSSEEAAEFLQGLLTKVGESADDGEVARLLDHVYAWQVHAHAPREEEARGGSWAYEDTPFAPLAKPLSDARVALFTSSGHFVAGDDPEPFGVSNMSQGESIARIQDFLRSKPQLSVIPADTPEGRLRVRHPGYDSRGALADPNVAFPLERMRGERHMSEERGRLGRALETQFSEAELTLLARQYSRWTPTIPRLSARSWDRTRSRAPRRRLSPAGGRRGPLPGRRPGRGRPRERRDVGPRTSPQGR